MVGMDYGIQRLSSSIPDVRRYHLFDSQNKLKLVADHGTPWILPAGSNQVRFGLPSGEVRATMDLTWTAREKRNGRQHVAYAIIVDHAVYAIINRYSHVEDNGQPDYFVLEVADTLWLALGKANSAGHYTLYDEIPSDLMISDTPEQADLPDPIGYLYQGLGEFDYNVVIPQKQITEPTLIALALSFLIDLNLTAS
jgi:hypothetical protein